MEDGQTIEVQGSGKKPYLLRNVGGVMSCTCPAWRNQGVPIERRTCKHLRATLGEEHEAARCAVNADARDTVLARADGRKLRQDEKVKLNGPPIMLAHSYDLAVDPTGWWYSEKLDGVRGYWTGTQFLSRAGNVFCAPEWFKEGLPPFPLDGELYLGRKSFEKTISIVKRQDAGDAWKAIRYVVFDCPDPVEQFERRIAKAHLGLAGAGKTEYAQLLKHGRIESPLHLEKTLKMLVNVGAEGIMLRKPGSLYEKGRSHDLLKVKPWADSEATVTGYEPGKGRHKGVVGALTVLLPNGLTFELGTGLTDADRRSPPPVGSKVTYRFTELTARGIPKCASFLRRRPDE